MKEIISSFLESSAQPRSKIKFHRTIFVLQDTRLMHHFRISAASNFLFVVAASRIGRGTELELANSHGWLRSRLKISRREPLGTYLRVGSDNQQGSSAESFENRGAGRKGSVRARNFARAGGEGWGWRATLTSDGDAFKD